MGRCAYCRKLMIGGRRQGNLRFCSDNCHELGFLLPLAERAGREFVSEQIHAAHEQLCPSCGGPGPVDVYTSHTAWSIIILTTWKSTPRLSCRRCGTAEIWRGITFTALCGWWGCPYGWIVTPIQLFRGVHALLTRPQAAHPSAALQHHVKLRVGSSIAKAA